MSESRLSLETDARSAAANLFRQSPPILVEVRFPNMGAAPDWHLLDDMDDLEALLNQLGQKAEMHLSSVWDLSNPRGAVRLSK